MDECKSLDGGVFKLIDLGSAALCLEKPLSYYPGNGPAVGLCRLTPV